MIHSIYSGQNIWNLREAFFQTSPIKHLILDDFIEPSIFEEFEKSITSHWYTSLQTDSHQDRTNKTIFINWEIAAKLYNFFCSEEFEQYISNIIWTEAEKEFSITQTDIVNRCWSNWLIWQVYEKGDYFWWHIDGHAQEQSLWAFTYYAWAYPWDWKENYGWFLELWEDHNGIISAYKKIVPKRNRFVLLWYSENAYHRVCENTSMFPRISIQSTIIQKKWWKR